MVRFEGKRASGSLIGAVAWGALILASSPTVLRAAELAVSTPARVTAAGQLPSDSRLGPLKDQNGYFPFMEDRRGEVVDRVRKARSAAIVVDDDFEKVGGLGKRAVILLGAEERRERILVPDVKADLSGGPHCLGGTINFGVDRMLAVGPKFLPGENLWVLQEQPPKSHEISVGRALAGGSRFHELRQLLVAFLRTRRVDAAITGRLFMQTRHG